MTAAACGIFFDSEDLRSNASEDARDAALSVEVPNEIAPDAGVEAEASACPTREGPVMVRVDDFCIDSTEVTRAQYSRFVADVGADAGGRPTDQPRCAENETFEALDTHAMVPSTDETPEFPVRGIDWCDAKAYCRWAGKDLCGALDGGALEPIDTIDPARSQWAKACTKHETLRFGYGDKYERGRCNVEEDPPRPARANQCPTGYPGVVDMVGNVAEWVDGCEPAVDKYAGCAALGGSTYDGEGSSCTSWAPKTWRLPWSATGIRCCAPVVVK